MSPATSTDTVGERVDPRVARSRQVILEATLDLLADEGLAGLNIEALAARAGVGKATIYRHFATREGMIEEAFETLKPMHVPDQAGSAREQITQIMTAVCTGSTTSRWGRVLPALIDAAERDPAILTIHRRISERRAEALTGVLEAGVTSGELRSDLDPDLAGWMLIGPLLTSRLMFHEAFPVDRVPALIEAVLGPA